MRINSILDRNVGKTRRELAKHVLNCTEEELFEICDTLNDKGIHVTSWSCEECEKRFMQNGCECDNLGICLEHFAEMDKTEN